MIFTGAGGVAEIIILILMVASAITFAIMDIRTREVDNKWLKLYAGFMAVPVVLAYIFDYVPNLGWWCILYVVLALGIPFFLWFTMKRWIGEADCKWLTITFIALPELILVFLVLLIIFVLLNFAYYKLRKRDELMPMMVPIACVSVIVTIINVIFAFAG